MPNKPRRCDTLLKGTVLTMDSDRRAIMHGYVAVTGNRIVGVGSESDCDFEADEVETGSNLILPGLINTHTHLVQGCIRGMAEGTEMNDRQYGLYYPMTGACDEDRSYWAAIAPAIEMLQTGITTSADDHFTHKHKRSVDGVIRAINDVGLRCRMARLTVNDPDIVPEEFRESVDEGLKETERLRTEWAKAETVGITASTVGICYVKPEELKDLAEWTQRNHERLHLHTPSAEDWRLVGRFGWEAGSFEYLDHVGILGPNVLAAHAQRLRAGEPQLIADRGANIALIPDMEMLLGPKNWDCRQLIERNVRVGLGFDGPVVSYHHSMWYPMRTLIIGQRLVDGLRGAPTDRVGITNEPWGHPELALELATIGGAKVLGIDNLVGSLEVGKEADIIVLDLTEAAHLAPPAALIANLVYGGGTNARCMKRVIVAGKTVLVDGNPMLVDVPDALHKANALQAELIEETGVQRFAKTALTWQWVGEQIHT